MPNPKRILCIGYDESLLVSRRMLLEQAGYDVVQALGFARASQVCRTDHTFDLIVMGHSIPQTDKNALIEMLKPGCKGPILSIRRPREMPLAEAQFSVDSMDGPGALLQMVRIALAENPPPASS